MMCWECSCQMEHVRRLTHDKRSSVRVVGAATKTLIRISEGSDRRVAMFWAAMLWYSFLFRSMRGRSESSASGRCESRANAQASLARPSALPAARQMHLVQTQPPPPNLNPRCPRAVRLSNSSHQYRFSLTIVQNLTRTTTARNPNTLPKCARNCHTGSSYPSNPLA